MGDPFANVQGILHNPDSPSYKPYQPGGYLEPIITGETLEISEQHYEQPSDPSVDENYPPGYPADTEQRARSPDSYYSFGPYDTDITDNYDQDTDPAYASGSYTRPLQYGARSRSPTPAVDDEDYQIAGDGSVHLNRSYDEEKAMDAIDEKDEYEYDHQDYDSYFSKSSAYHYSSPLTSTQPMTPVETRHFGPAPTGRITRRHKEKKRINLTNGNLVIELPVPPKLILPWRGEPETKKTRYTAVTGDPNDFEKKGFTLRQVEMGRRTELFIVITMYNEDEILFCRTLYNVMQNISHLCDRKNSQTWGPDSWKKVVVCIVADGRKKVHPRVLDCLTLLGVYQFGDHMKNKLNTKEITAHLFEYTTSFALDSNLHFRYPDKKGIVPTQIIFCMKEKNQKKINSHRWALNAFAPLLQPNVVVLLDVGTMPGPKSIYRLWKTFDLNSNVGGACGEISVFKGRRWSLLLNPLVAAQNFEYKISSILDKTTESVFGYISVLPGAFSAYRYFALQNDDKGVGPLASYFKGEELHGSETDIFTSNMYLAEDRILCFELVAKRHCNWVLNYVKSAVAETDVPEHLPEFVNQRRRWLNGSFFAAVYAISHVGQIMRSGHSLVRKTALMVETCYNVLNLTFAWFSLGNFYLFFIVLTASLEDQSFHLNGIQYVNTITHYALAAMIIACFLFSMGNKPQASKWKYKLTAIFFGCLMIYLIFASIFCAVHAADQGGTANSVMLFSVIITYGCYAYGSILAFDPWHMLTSFLPYVLLSPVYINLLSIYAFSNLDDISWGTKQDSIVEIDLGVVISERSQVDVEMFTEVADVNKIYEEAVTRVRDRRKPLEKAPTPSQTNAEKDQAAKDYYANVRANILLTWVLSNGLLLVLIMGGTSASDTFTTKMSLTKGYITFILAFTCIANLIRAMGSTLYLMARFIMG